MKTMPICLLAYIPLIFLLACSKKSISVAGQVFILTKGQESSEMGGLEVIVIPNGEFLSRAKATVPWMQVEVLKDAQMKADDEFINSFIHDVQEMEKRSVVPIPELPGIRKAITEESVIAESLIDSDSSGQILQCGILKLISSTKSTLSVKTDADGRFTVSVTGKTWFLAVGHREVGNETEKYLWVKDYEPRGDAKSGTLSISNEAEIDSEDGLYSLLSGVTGSSGDLDEFRKCDVSEKMKLSVARHRATAIAAMAKAEIGAAKVKANLEHEAAEAKTRLFNEFGAGRVGSSVSLPLLGSAIMQFAFCSAGSFTMGSPLSEAGRDRNECQVPVTISKNFWMAKTEVTQAQWQAVMGSNPSHFKGHDLPAEKLSWDDAQNFIKKVNGSGIIPPRWKMALPTEAQWEYACRAGETGPFAGGPIDQVAWYGDNSEDKTHPVGEKKPNSWGLYDMHGNVDEWCSDWSDNTLLGGTDPSGASSGICRVDRGGSWFDSAAYCRAASQHPELPDVQGDSVGFRPALILSK